jgi:inhibitor of KinA sporulation pathway (predicted exonuclease)
MATTTYEEATLTLMDGTTITVRPLKISLLRPFTKKFEGIDEVQEDNEKSINLLLECVAIAMQQYAPELADVKKLEEIMDLPTVYKIIEAASGVPITQFSQAIV